MQTVQRFFFTSCASAALAIGLFAAQPAAQARPANATAQCKDGTFSTAKTRRGACAGHDGVQTWFAEENTKDAAKATKDDTKAAAKSTKGAAKDAGAAAKDTGKDVGSAAKDVGKEIGSAAKDVGKTTKNASKDVAKTTKDDSKAVGTAAKGESKAVGNGVVARPSDAPADATAQCKDGTYSKATTHRGACSGHGGVAAWFK